MATQRWLSSLANIETRLRRSLGLAGPVGTKLDAPATVMPVVIVDDATRPGGHALVRGRGFSFASQIVVDVDTADFRTYLYTDSPSGVIITHMDVSAEAQSGEVTSQWEVFQFHAGQDMTASLSFSREAVFTEAPVSSQDFAPIFSVTGDQATELPAPAASCIWRGFLPDYAGETTGASAAPHRIDLNAYLAPPPKLGGGITGPGVGGGIFVRMHGGSAWSGGYVFTLFGKVY